METELTLAQVKTVQLEILEFIDRTLRQQNIDYWLDGGTLLGAIRHQGYIPWDDDIDLIVRRADYDRAIEALSHDARFRVMSMYTTAGYFYLFAKVTDSTTRVVEDGVRAIDGLGICIDLFPLDTLPEDERARRQFYDTVFRLRSILYHALLPEEKYKNAPLVKKLKCRVGRLYGWQRAMRKVDALCRASSAHNHGPVVDIVAAWHKHRDVSAKAFAKTQTGLFEGKEYPIPAGYDAYLTALYGDYMTPPPEKDRVPTHSFKAYQISQDV